MLHNRICLAAACAAWAMVLVLGTPSARSEDPASAPVAIKASPVAPANPKLVRLPWSFRARTFEPVPVLYKGRPLIVLNGLSKKSGEETELFIRDLITGERVADVTVGYGFNSAIANGDELNVFSTKVTEKDWTTDIYRFSSTDLKTWKRELVVTRDGDEHFFNTSVCRDDQGYVMAYESNKPVQWSFRFARSKDLSKWEPVEGLEFSDVEGKTACANPNISYFAPYYYVVYGVWRWDGPGKYYEYRSPETKYTTAVARSKDLANWEVSPTRGPMLDPFPGEGINNTDADLLEYEGNTYIYYVTGDQSGKRGTTRVAMYAGPMKEMLEAYFPAGPATIKFDARQRKYIYP